MNSINSRLRRLEERAGDRCPECSGELERIVVAYDDAACREALDDLCPQCGRQQTVVITVVYDD
jgi:hypothetical protein